MIVVLLAAAAISPVSGDFDHDGLADRAYLREAGESYEVVVERGTGETAVVETLGNPSGLYLSLLPPGVYETACGKGFGSSAAPCPEPSLSLDRPALEFGSHEASQAVAVWNGARFRVVWLSD